MDEYIHTPILSNWL